MVKPSGINWNAPVVYAVASENYTTLHYRKGNSILVSYTLKFVMSRFTGLVRIHKNAAVQLSYIKRYEYSWIERRMTIWLKDGTRLSVSRRLMSEVKSQLLHPQPAERVRPA